MKKIYLLLAALAVAATACNKAEIDTETPEAPETPAVQKTNMVYIGANLPEFVDNDTRATISETGAFAWENGEKIYILCKNVAGGTYDGQYFHVPFTYDDSKQQFGCDLENAVVSTIIGGNPTVINGPFTIATNAEATSNNIPLALNHDPIAVTTSGDYDKIGKFFKMEGSFDTDGSIKFEHKSALVKLDYENLPAIANTIKVTNGSETVTVRLQQNAGDDVTGDASVMIPLTPSGASEAIKFELLTDDNKVLVSKTKIATIVAGKLYKTPKITINPSVYLISDLTSWDYTNAKAIKMTGTGAARTVTLIGDENKYYRYLVDYGAVQIDMGPSADGSTSLDETFTVIKNASKLTAYNAYVLTFDFVSGQNTVSTIPPQAYVTGSFQTPTAWQLNKDMPMTMANDREGYLVINAAANSSCKAYSDPCLWEYVFPSANVELKDENYYLLVANIKNGTLTEVYAGATSSSNPDKMYIYGSTNGWSSTDVEVEMTQIENTPFWYAEVDWSAIQPEFKFVKRKSGESDVWMAESDHTYATSSSSWGWSNGNLKLASGKYLIIASESNGRFAILDKN